MVEFDKEKIAKMQQYLAEITDPNFQGSATDKRMAVAERIVVNNFFII